MSQQSNQDYSHFNWNDLFWDKTSLGKKTPWKEIFGVPFCMIFFGMWSLPQILRHKYQGKMDPRDCLHEKINFDRGNKKLRRKGNLWMLATLASQIPILSFGVASAWIGIFLIRSRCSLIRKILPIPSQFFVTGVKIRYFNQMGATMRSGVGFFCFFFVCLLCVYDFLLSNMAKNQGGHNACKLMK